MAVNGNASRHGQTEQYLLVAPKEADKEYEMDSVAGNRGGEEVGASDFGSPVDEKNNGEIVTAVDQRGDRFSSVLQYGLLDFPPIPIMIMAALQHILLSVSGCLTTSSVVADVACVPYDHYVRSQLFCTTIFMVGLCTIMQTAFGVRLPIFQGPSSSFLVPLLALQRDVVWQCDRTSEAGSTLSNGYSNITVATNLTVAQESTDPMPGISWRIQEMSGALIVASIVEVILGMSGLLNVMLHFIGPITVACTISLIGVSLYKLPIKYGRPSFPIALGCMALSVTFILYMQRVVIPLPKIGKGRKGKKRPNLAIFQLLPILLAVVIMWGIIWILTICNVFSDDKNDVTYMARGDAKINIITSSPWFQITYPGQFGTPRISIALVLGFLVAILSSIVESVGDYYAAHKACQLPAPPEHAISRGIMMEGIGSVISGSVGAGHATTSYSGNIAVLTLTKTTSRSVMYCAGIILLIVSMFGKIGASLTTIPNPVLGGVIMTIVGTLISIGFSYLKQVDMASSRNMLVVGVPFAAGIVIPECLDMYPDIINTGNEEADRVIKIILGTPMFLGGMLALILDATAPGTRESRGMAHMEQVHTSNDDAPDSPQGSVADIYSWSFYSRVVKCCPFLSYLPFMPKRPSGNRNTIDVESPQTPED